MMQFLETDWQLPDEGIWEVRGPRRHFTHSKVMAWVTADRAVKAIEHFQLDGPLDRWRQLRQEIHAQVCREGFDPALNSFVQYYGSKQLDASLLMMPLVGFLPVTDPRMRGTVEAVEQRLVRDGFVDRYPTLPEVDGLPSGAGAFLVCTFWLTDNLVLQGRYGSNVFAYVELRLFATSRTISRCSCVPLYTAAHGPLDVHFVNPAPAAPLRRLAAYL